MWRLALEQVPEVSSPVGYGWEMVSYKFKDTLKAFDNFENKQQRCVR